MLFVFKLLHRSNYFEVSTDYLLSGVGALHASDLPQKENALASQHKKNKEGVAEMDMNSFIKGIREENAAKVQRENEEKNDLRKKAISASMSDFKRFFSGYGFSVDEVEDENNVCIYAMLDKIEESKVTLSYPKDELTNQTCVVQFALDMPKPISKKYWVDACNMAGEKKHIEYFLCDLGIPWRRGQMSFNSLHELLNHLLPSSAEQENRALREMKIEEANDSTENGMAKTP